MQKLITIRSHSFPPFLLNWPLGSPNEIEACGCVIITSASRRRNHGLQKVRSYATTTIIQLKKFGNRLHHDTWQIHRLRNQPPWSSKACYWLTDEVDRKFNKKNYLWGFQAQKGLVQWVSCHWHPNISSSGSCHTPEGCSHQSSFLPSSGAGGWESSTGQSAVTLTDCCWSNPEPANGIIMNSTWGFVLAMAWEPKYIKHPVPQKCVDLKMMRADATRTKTKTKNWK